MVAGVSGFRCQTQTTFSPWSVGGQERGGGGGAHRARVRGRCALHVDLSSTSLLVSATRVSHGIQGHRRVMERAAKSETRCPPGQRAGTLSRSSDARPNNQAKQNQNKVKEKEESGKCRVGSLSVQLLFFCLRQKIRKSIRALFGRGGKSE